MIELKDQIEIKDVSEEVMGWKRNIVFRWISPDNPDTIHLCRIALYWSEFDGYSYNVVNAPPEFEELLAGRYTQEIAEFFDDITWKKLQ